MLRTHGVARHSYHRALARLSSMAVLGMAALGGGVAHAQRTSNPTFSIGVGMDHALSDIDMRPGVPMPYVSIEAATAVLVERIDLRLRAGTDASPYGAWIGAGPSLSFDIGSTPLFVEGSLMPGYWVDFDHRYREGLFEHGLGHPLEFRTQIGIGWHLDDVSSVLLALSHKSNANIDGAQSNPGIEAVQLRYNQSF